ncbi:MAG: ABC transporter permease, partial [Oscillibacter sp.]
MTKKLRSTTRRNGPAVLAIAVLLLVWTLASASGLVPRYMLPSPMDVARAFIGDFPALLGHAGITLQEAFYGLTLGVAIGFVFA